jgi:eukaryotic-like serine/threonine-protein kinase
MEKATGIMACEQPQDLARGSVLAGRYRILERRASGGMGQVYVASHVRSPGRFALKVLGPELREEPAAVAWFAQEAEMLALAQHPNVVILIEFEANDAGGPFLAMEYLEGQDLAEHIRERGPLPLPRVAVMVAQIAAALEAAHARGIVHADVKPSNVMLVDDHDDLVKLVDFGIARPFGQTRSREASSAGTTMRMPGTPAYMAPEQAQGLDEQVDSRSDQFSLAALSQVLLTGEDPFPGGHTVEVLERIVHAQPTALVGRVRWPAHDVAPVLERALSKWAADRYPTVAEFAAEFARAAAMTVERWGRRMSSAAACALVEGAGPSRAGIRQDPAPQDQHLVATARIGWQTTVRARPLLGQSRKV